MRAQATTVRHNPGRDSSREPTVRDTTVRGIITSDRKLRCGGKRPDNTPCDHFFCISQGRVDGLQHPCPRCKAENLFHEPLPELELARLDLARDQEKTDLTLAEALRVMADNFSVFLQQRGSRLVMAQTT